jgi:hypothetical protein
MATAACICTRREALAGMLAASLIGEAHSTSSHPMALGRPLIDFIQSQVVPSRVLGATNSQPGVTGTPLSYDAKGSRSVSVIFRFPKDWSMQRPHYINSDQEFLVLEGELEINGLRYQTGDYAYLPAGFAHQTRSSWPGATLLNFYEGEHLAFYADTPEGMFQPDRLITRIATTEIPWTTTNDPTFTTLGADVRVKELRRDPTSQEGSWLVRVSRDAAIDEVARSEVVHAHVEECFLIEGQIETPQGPMRRGAYVWRTPGQPRGPYGSTTGYTLLVRGKGGPLDSRTLGVPRPIQSDRPYRPVIPESAKSFAFNPLPIGQAY